MSENENKKYVGTKFSTGELVQMEMDAIACARAARDKIDAEIRAKFAKEEELKKDKSKRIGYQRDKKIYKGNKNNRVE